MVHIPADVASTSFVTLAGACGKIDATILEVDLFPKSLPSCCNGIPHCPPIPNNTQKGRTTLMAHSCMFVCSKDETSRSRQITAKNHVLFGILFIIPTFFLLLGLHCRTEHLALFPSKRFSFAWQTFRQWEMILIESERLTEEE